MKLQFTNPCPSGESLGGSFLNKSKIKYNTKKVILFLVLMMVKLLSIVKNL